MAMFKDYKGNDWELRIVLGDYDRIQSKTGIDMEAVLSDEKLAAEFVFGKRGKIGQVLHVLCEDQIKERNMTPEQFMRCFDGPTIETAVETLLIAVADFSSRSRVGQVMREVLGPTLKRMDDTMEKMLREKLEGVDFDKLPGNLQEPSESIHAL